MELTLKIKISVVFLLIPTMYLIIIGIVYLTLGSFMPYHQTYTGISWSKLKNYDPELAYLVSVFIRLIGVLMISLGLCCLLIIYLVIWKDEKIAWIIGVISSNLYLAVSFVVAFPVIGATIMYFATILFTILCIIAWIITGKELYS